MKIVFFQILEISKVITHLAILILILKIGKKYTGLCNSSTWFPEQF